MRHARARKASLRNFGWFLILWIVGALIVGYVLGWAIIELAGWLEW